MHLRTGVGFDGVELRRLAGCVAVTMSLLGGIPLGVASQELGSPDTTRSAIPAADVPLLMTTSYMAGVLGDVDRNAELTIRSHFRIWPRQNGGQHDVPYQQWLQGNERWWRYTSTWSIGVQARRHTKFRGTDVKSSPIRTPSLTWEWAPWPEFYYVRRTKTGSNMFGFIPGPFNHYSNGQAGCFFEGYSRVPPGAGDCVPNNPDSVPDRPTINAQDGSFSTNMTNAVLGYSHRGLDSISGNVTSEQGFRVGLTHFWTDTEVPLPGGADKQLLDRYGRDELTFDGWWQPARLGTPGLFGWMDGPVILEVEGFYRWGGVDQRPSAHSGLSAGARWLIFNEESGLFARYYRGGNYYNINFEEQTNDPTAPAGFWMIGVVWDVGRLRTMGPPP